MSFTLVHLRVVGYEYDVIMLFDSNFYTSLNLEKVIQLRCQRVYSQRPEV